MGSSGVRTALRDFKYALLIELARPERLELPTYWFEASRSIHLSYGRAEDVDM